MKHYVLGFLFNSRKDEVLLVRKNKPEWMSGRFNGIGGKIDSDKTPFCAMQRESLEEIGDSCDWRFCLTLLCPGGTVYVFRSFSFGPNIVFEQIEDELLKVWSVSSLPPNSMSNLKWLIPICLSTIQFPLLVMDTTLGI